MDWHGASMASEVIFRDPVEVFTWKWCVKHCVCCLEVTLLYFTFQEQRPMYNPRRGHSKRMTHWSWVTCPGHSVKIILKSSQISCWSLNRDLCRDLHRSGVRGWLRHRSQPLYSTVLTVHSVHLNTGSYIGGQRVNTNCNTNKIFSVQLSPRSHITKDLQRCNAAKRTQSPLNLNIHTTGGVSFK